MSDIEKKARELLVIACGVDLASFQASLMLDPRIQQSGVVETAAALKAISAALSQQQAVPEGSGMLPDALVPVADEWYRLCERRFAVNRISISGNLAEAIVEAMGSAKPATPPAVPEGFVLVPVDLTREMEAAGYPAETAQEGWAAMLAARPEVQP